MTKRILASPIVNHKAFKMVCWVVPISMNLEIDARPQPSWSGLLQRPWLNKIRQSTIGRWDKQLVDQVSDVRSIIFFSLNFAKFFAKTLSIIFFINENKEFWVP